MNARIVSACISGHTYDSYRTRYYAIIEYIFSFSVWGECGIELGFVVHFIITGNKSAAGNYNISITLELQPRAKRVFYGNICQRE